MSVKIVHQPGEPTITAMLDGEIDQHSAQTIRETIDNYINQGILDNSKVSLLNLDFSGVKFTDSSGIGLILGRYKLMKQNGGELKVINIPRNLERMVKLGGLAALGIFNT